MVKKRKKKKENRLSIAILFFFWAFEINILPNVLGCNIYPITLFGSDFHLAHLTKCFYLNYPKEVLSLKALSLSDHFGGKEKNTNRNYNNGSRGARRESGSGGGGVRCIWKKKHSVSVRSDRISPAGMALAHRSLGPSSSPQP